MIAIAFMLLLTLENYLIGQPWRYGDIYSASWSNGLVALMTCALCIAVTLYCPCGQHYSASLVFSFFERSSLTTYLSLCVGRHGCTRHLDPEAKGNHHSPALQSCHQPRATTVTGRYYR